MKMLRAGDARMVRPPFGARSSQRYVDILWRGVHCGHVSEGMDLYTSHRFPAHYCYVEAGFGIQTDILIILEYLGIETVRIHYHQEAGKSRDSVRLETPLDIWLMEGHERVLRDVDGLQVFLPMSMMTDAQEALETWRRDRAIDRHDKKRNSLDRFGLKDNKRGRG